MSGNPTCATCRWWDDPYAGRPEADWPMKHRKGQCRRHAPQPDVQSGSWVFTESRDWCGEHAPRPVSPPEEGS